MNYIWEVFLKAKELEISIRDITFRQAENPSPYTEVALGDLNPIHIDNQVEVNPYYRYSSIFHSLIEGELKEYPEIKNVLFDILIHFLGELDILQGLSKKDYYRLFLWEDIKKNVYGRTYIDAAEIFSFKQKSVLLKNMGKLYLLGPSMELLRLLMKELYPDSLLYSDKIDKKVLLVYIGKKQTQELQKQMQFILGLFVTLDYELELFWDMHFGIIGVEETMQIGEFTIY